MVEQSLEAWAGASWCDGLQLDSCQDLEHILVRTANTVYQLIVLHGRAGEVLIRGGRFFPDFRRVRFAGATAGGNVIKLLGLYRGLRIELDDGRERVITSPVQSIARKPAVAD